MSFHLLEFAATLLVCLAWIVLPCRSFFAPSALGLPFRRSSTSTSLHGITEWRDIMFDFPGTGDDRRLGIEREQVPPKEICILPFPFADVLLQGETKQLRLYEDRFIQLFDTCMEKHAGVVAMGLLASSSSSSGMIQTVPICEIEAYNRMEGFGIFVTIRAVGRARLLEITQQQPFLKAVCVELTDALPPNLDLPNLAASNIENYMLLLSSMEHRLTKAKQENSGKDTDKDDSDMQRRINIAKLEDRFYNDLDEEDDGDDDSDKEEEGDYDLDRRGRFRKAYQVALSTDTQGYQHSMSPSASLDRTPQELTAMSWAAFCTELVHDIEHSAYRIQALDSEKLFDRLKLAVYMLRQKKEQLVVKMEKAGLKFRGDDELDLGDRNGGNVGGGGI